MINLVYLAARDQFINYKTPEEAIQQIKDKKYVLRFTGKLGEKKKYTGKILAVGISYNKKTKEHVCKVEELCH